MPAFAKITVKETTPPDASNPFSPRKWIYGGVSATAYKGSLSSAYAQFSPSLHVGLRLSRSKRLNGTFQLSLGSVTGSSSRYDFKIPANSNATPANSFHTNFFMLNYELSLSLVKRRRFCWYISQGIGFMHFEVYDSENKSLFDNSLSRATGESYLKNTVILPSSTGIYGLLPGGYGLGFQAGWWNTGTDYIDNLSKLSDGRSGDNLLFYKFTVMVPVR
ncbi:MAG: hypothetical protein V4543_11440 [Bacteroidota bacterium]